MHGKGPHMNTCMYTYVRSACRLHTCAHTSHMETQHTHEHSCTLMYTMHADSLCVHTHHTHEHTHEHTPLAHADTMHVHTQHPHMQTHCTHVHHTHRHTHTDVGHVPDTVIPTLWIEFHLILKTVWILSCSESRMYLTINSISTLCHVRVCSVMSDSLQP